MFGAVFLVVCCTAQSLVAQGMITGRVSNAATRINLEGARVEVQGQNRVELTDSEGVYRIMGLPAGSVSLSVSYTGLKTQVVTLQFGGTGTARQDVALTSDVYVMGRYTVSGEREGNALAITMQRNSAGVKSIVSSDAFGNLAGNPADLLMRMPGIAGDSVGGDIRFIRIRGLHHNLASVSMDGNRIADAASAGDTREVQWQQAGTENVERVEVTKSPTPDMPADSIGGAVNVVTKSAFDRSERYLGGSFGAAWRPTDERSRPMRQWSVSYSEVFKGKYGVAFNYGHQPVESLIYGATQLHQALPAGVDGPAYTYSLDMRDSANKRTRWNGSLKLDYKLSDRSRFYASVIMNKHDEHANSRESMYQTAQTVATVDASGNFTNANAIVPGYTDNRTDWRPVTASFARAGAFATQKIGKAWNYQLGAVHRFEGLDLEYDAYHSWSETRYPGNKLFSIFARGIGLRLERDDEPFVPTLTQLAGPDVTRVSSYTDNTYSIAASTGEDQYWGASVDAKKKFNTVVPSFIKAGLRTREQTRDLTDTPWTGRYLGTNYGDYLNPDTRNSMFDGRYPLLPHPAFPGRDTPGSARNQPAGPNIDQVFRSNPQLFARNTVADLQADLVGRVNFKENVNAAYILGSVDLGKLNILAGLRVEETETEAEGSANQISPEEAARRAAFVGPITEAETIRRTTAQFSGRVSRKGEYRGVFPGVHFKYEILRNFISRLSYATNIGRPNISQIVPTSTVNYDNRTISSSNPNLLPQYSDNFDLNLEYYFEPAGLLSAGVFLKEMKDFIFTQGGAFVGSGPDNGFGGLYDGFQLTTQYNGGRAKIKGLELSYTQQFTFLPGWLKGFGAYANYTRIKAEGDYGVGNAITLGAVNAHTNEVANFVPESGNLGISYILNKLSLRFQFNHVGKYLNTYNANRSRMLYRKARSVVDIKFYYQYSRNLDFYCDVQNTLAEADRALEYFGGRPQRMDKMHTQFYFGLRGRL